MYDLPTPPPVHNEAVVHACISQSSKYWGVPEIALHAIRRVEGGRVGTVSRNSNGTFDLGVMQFNTSNLVELNRATKRHVSASELVNNACVNIYVAGWWLAKKIEEANGDLWRGVGNYHSRTPSKHIAYLTKIRDAVAAIRKQSTKRT